MTDARGYDERVMDQIRNARAYRVLDDATHQAYDINPLCGDEMTVYVRISPDRVEELAYQCSCGGVAMASTSASASMMSE